jgi:FkbM family methyltransferase
VFFDVGAHVGFYSLMASRRVGRAGRVVAFEPNPRNIAYLRRHVTLNAAPNIEIVEAAVSSRSGWVGFEAPGDSSMGQVRDDTDPWVPSVSLDAWSAEHAVFPAVVKIDVEGHELPVLQGATELLSHTRPTIVLSVGPDSLSACRAVLDTHDYVMNLIESPHNSTEFACFPRPSSSSSAG